jgi:hypothetical protein
MVLLRTAKIGTLLLRSPLKAFTHLSGVHRESMESPDEA